VPCFHPMKGYRARRAEPSGKRRIVFNKKDGFEDLPVTVPCGQCAGCRLERSRQWAIRCMHEASLYDQNCFITLTYNNEHLPDDRSLNVRDFQLFMKRLRKKYGADIRFFHCGEYGSKLGRPHYHACLFNFDFADKELFKLSNDVPLYRSNSLEQLWPFGFSTIGDVTFESAAYVARYVMKKVNGDAAKDHYQYVDPVSGEVHQLKPEYITMSRRPGIGRDWIEKFRDDVYPGDFVVVRGKKCRPPRYYDREYEIMDPDGFKEIKRQRKSASAEHADNNTPARLKVREKVQLSKLRRLPRSLEDDL